MRDTTAALLLMLVGASTTIPAEVSAQQSGRRARGRAVWGRPHVGRSVAGAGGASRRHRHRHPARPHPRGASARFEEGAGPRIDIVRARADAERARAEVEALALQVDAASSRIAVLVAPSRGNASFRAEGDAPMPDVPAAAEVLARLGEHPLAERAGLEVEAADAVVTRQHRARWPLIYLQTQGTLWEQYGPPTEDFNVQLGFDLPIFDEPLITRAETQRATAQIARDALAAQLRGAALGARSDYLAAHTRATAQLEHALPAAREASELSREAYTAGGLDLTATLLAEQMRADAELSAAQAIAALGRALATLEHALGRPL